MADKPKKAKGKLVGKKKAVKKAKPSAAPVEQGSGLNVESKPKAPVGFTGTYEHEPRAFRPLKPEGIGPSEKSIREAVIAVGKRRGVNANEALWQAENLAPQGKSIIHGAKGIHPDNFFLGREPQQGSAPAFGPRNTTKNPVESLRKGTKDDFVKMKTSKAKEVPSFQGAMKAGKEKKAANKGLLEGMAKGAKDFPGPKDEKKQMAAMDMASKMAKAGKEVRDAQEKDTKKKARLKGLGQHARSLVNEGIQRVAGRKELDKQIKILQHQNYAEEQSAQPHTPAPAFGPRQSSSNAKSGGMGSIPGANVTSPMAAKMSASAKSFTGPTASQKVIAGMSEAGQQAKDKKQKKLNAFKNIGAKAKSAFTGPNKPKKSEKFLSGIENLLGEIDAHNNKKSGKPYSLPKPPASSQKSPADFRQNAKNAFQKMKTDNSNKGKAASDPTLKNPFSGRTKQSSEAKHNSPERGPIYKGGHANDKKRSAEKPVSALKKKVAAPQSSSPSLASKAGGAIKGADTHPTITGFLKATGVHLGMAAMHGTNYPRVMAQHASQGPREFKPGWHGFTSPVEKPKAEEATDTKGERA